MAEPAGTIFPLELPAGYRAGYALVYHGRDKASVSEQVEGQAILKPLLVGGEPALLVIDLAGTEDPASPLARFWLDRPVDPETAVRLRQIVARMLGLSSDAAAFEALPGAERLVGSRRGLRLPLTADAFEAVCWAVIGQQINLTFAAALRRAVIAKLGVLHEPSGLRVHPGPAEVAALDPAELATLRFSRSKARYLVEAAGRIADGSLPLEALAGLPAAEAEAALCALHGIGPWTARYIQLRGFGSPDIAPVGDSGLAAALQKLLGLPIRPDATAQEAAMRAFAPHRSLATAHLWASLAPSQG